MVEQPVRPEDRRSPAGGRWCGLLALLAILTGCSGIQVQTDYDRDRDFSRYTSFAWYNPPAPATTGLGVTLDEDMQRRLMRRVGERLEQRGLQPSTPLAADLRLRYLVTVEERVQFNDPFYVHDVRTTYEEGSLVLEFVDANTGNLAWRGVGRARLRESASPEAQIERMEKAVDAVLDRYPGGR